MSNICYVIKHPELGYHVGYQRAGIFQSYIFEVKWGDAPILSWYISIFPTREDAESYLKLRACKFPSGCQIVEWVL